MVQHRRFLGMTLDNDGLHTPDGTFDLYSITRAELVRRRLRPTGSGGSEPSLAATAGGSLVGGAIAGPVGFLGGGLLGSQIRREDDTGRAVPRTVSLRLVFESPRLAYSVYAPADLLDEAEEFVASVKAAASL